ncbi:hypothetical protein D3C87_109170 [compost metagenome]
MTHLIKNVLIHKAARKVILEWPESIRKDLGSLLTVLQKGHNLGYPDVDSMSSVAPGCLELRLKGPDGIYRAFYVVKSEFGILVFHCFQKKTQVTPHKEIETAKKRLRKFLEELKDEKD